MNRVDVVYGPNGEAYLVLRKELPQKSQNFEKESKDESERGVVIIDMFEKEDEIYYEC